jgi:hypothetical protein
VENIYPFGGGVVLDLDWLSDRLEGVSETEKELRGFREVFHAGGRGREVGAPVGGEYRRKAIEEEGM